MRENVVVENKKTDLVRECLNQSLNTPWNTSDLLSELPNDAWNGFRDRVSYACDHKLETAAQIGAAVLTGAALAATIRNPGLACAIVGGALEMGAVFTGVTFGLGIIGLYNAGDRRDPEDYMRMRQFQRELFGGLLFDVPVISASGGVALKGLSWSENLRAVPFPKYSSMGKTSFVPRSTLVSYYPSVAASLAVHRLQGGNWETFGGATVSDLEAGKKIIFSRLNF